MINWEFKEDAEQQGGSDGFWYDITDGGYIRPEELLKNEEQIKKINEAIDIVMSFEKALEDNDLILEF